MLSGITRLVRLRSRSMSQSVEPRPIENQIKRWLNSSTHTPVGSRPTYVEPTIGIVGAAGNMGSCLTRYIVGQGYEVIGCVEHSDEIGVVRDMGAEGTADFDELMDRADTLILSVKPGDMRELCRRISRFRSENRLIIPVAAGISCQQYKQWLDWPIVRIMPNMLMSPDIGSGSVGSRVPIAASAEGPDRHWYEHYIEILFQLSDVRWCDDEDMDAIMVATACSPAIYAHLIKSFTEHYMAMGLDEVAAFHCTRAIMAQTIKQIDQLSDCDDLIRTVSSPGGATEQALNVLELGHIDAILGTSLTTAHRSCSQIRDALKDD